LLRALSPLGRRAYFPPDIPAQSAQARGKEINGTIGQITDGRGGAVPLPPLAEALSGLSAPDRNQALLYSPIEGMAEARRLWRQWQRRHLADDRLPSTLPLVTIGLTHALSILADLFGGEGKALALPRPFWGNYRQTFAARTGAVVVGVARPVLDLPPDSAHPAGRTLVGVGEPAVTILNLPSNPGGYSLTVEERKEVIASLRGVAERRPLVVICDDAYAGLVFEPDVPRTSLFWELIGLHPNLVPVKIDGATKEFSFFGGRVGFVTFAAEQESDVGQALESKLKMLVRSVVGSPISASQVLLLQALRRPDIETEIETVRRLLEERYRALKKALSEVDPRHLTVLPFNSGCFALVELPEALGLGAEQVRRHLLDHHDTGLIAMEPRYLRIAHCSVDEAAIPELVRRVEAGIRELARA